MHGADVSWDTCDEGQGSRTDVGPAVCAVAGLVDIEGFRCDLTLFITSEHDEELDTVAFKLSTNESRNTVWEKIR